MSDDEYQALERRLAKAALTKQALPEPKALAAKVVKQDKSKELVRLGVHGVFSMLLTLFAPLMMSHSKKLLKKKVKAQ
ncbi:hypothetical protein FX988_00489 [Paraglaciecola mesophila]|uniref:Uncharacterized protein n=1 Tax=Paraglaciecola mesophila TaxID=197222 RepID=A0A857JH68_9ALTE|nr:hypothetical protein [Paraglaciecola mesophila]QHJ10277.1 hypothetical protein FX988_00489 [Paraglaciecola mesophila]